MELSDGRTAIGAYPVANNLSLIVYELDEENNRVLAGLAGQEDTEWCDMCWEDGEPGFMFGLLFVPFPKVVRL